LIKRARPVVAGPPGEEAILRVRNQLSKVLSQIGVILGL
jgi:hypothetical protein